MSQLFDVIVIGAGAAGLFCSSVAGQRGRRVALIDHEVVVFVVAVDRRERDQAYRKAAERLK